MKRVDLTQTELQILDYVASRRFIETSKHGTDRKQDNTRSGWEIVLDGVYGEYAVAKSLNLLFDLNCDYRKFGADLVSKKGTLIDVKSTRWTDGPLNATGWSEDKPADIFILTEIYDSYVLIKGYVDRETFLSKSNKRNGTNGEYFSLPQKFLKVISAESN